jgi:hypothetical protein
MDNLGHVAAIPVFRMASLDILEVSRQDGECGCRAG